MRKTVWMLALAVSAAVCGAEKTVMVEEGATRGLEEALAAARVFGQGFAEVVTGAK